MKHHVRRVFSISLSNACLQYSIQIPMEQLPTLIVTGNEMLYDVKDLDLDLCTAMEYHLKRRPTPEYRIEI